jgi:RNA polymerase sigma-B factor
MTTALGVAIALGAIVCAVVVAAGQSLLSDEARAWLPHLARWLVRSAARRLQEQERDRYEEEWLAELAAWSDRPLSALGKAAHIRWRAREMRASLGSAELVEHGGSDRRVDAPVAQLFEGLASDGNLRDRDAMVERYLPLARDLALRYKGSGESLEDVLQAASLGLIKAIDSFAPQRGIAFAAYAEPTIVGEIERYFRDRWAVHVPSHVQDLALRVDRAVGELSERLHRGPTVAEIAVAIGADEKAILEALEAGGAHKAYSFEEPRFGFEEDEVTLGDSISVFDDGFANVESRLTCAALLKVVTARERQVLRMRFEQDMTQAEIAATMEVSEIDVSRIINGALERIRRAMLPYNSRPAA